MATGIRSRRLRTTRLYTKSRASRWVKEAGERGYLKIAKAVDEALRLGTVLRITEESPGRWQARGSPEIRTGTAVNAVDIAAGSSEEEAAEAALKVLRAGHSRAKRSKTASA